MKMDRIQTLKKRAEVFYKDKIPAHVITNNDTWLNGYIVGVYDDYFYILDRMDDKLPVFYADVSKFEFFSGKIESLKPISDGRKEDDTTNKP